ncbi:tRNA ligase [Neophaeococcomyces mojaviensis]|uniref:tRNA ligase n=1 Tax=Neophaeococcomyces mojaviensis TaxID=3383035 RepID=A0ACC3A5R6_9EURO|nr:tRNA ligase [Knufia sp. JES_112]
MAQDQHQVRQVIHALESAKSNSRKGGKKGYSCKKSTFSVSGSNIFVDSWKFNDWDYKRDDLPTYARGLFTTKREDGMPEIVIRGYDKFFNVGEVRETEWKNIERDTVGPYELSVKENGCIIFMSGLEDGTLLVCSKHSTGVRQDVEKSHAVAGEQWIARHVESVGKSTKDLAKALREMNATAVGELCDDAFEEHVLAYPPELAGIYLHGINYNLPEFATLSGPEVHRFADTWGFKKAEYQMIQDLDEVKKFLDKCAETGSWAGRDTEGFVVRCKVRGTSPQQPGRDWFFKYKFEEPYLMYRQWRECTKQVIAGKPPRFKKHKQITEEYLLYARRRLAQDPKLSKRYNQNHGIIEMRDGFLKEKGKSGASIIAEEQASEHNGADSDAPKNILLVPIATIGCGKTTVAGALVKLFGWGHIQNDDIQGKGNRPGRFALQVTNTMAQHNVVIADRNNHQKRERQQIIEDVAKVIPDTKFVALHYVHDPKDKMLKDIRRITTGRVLDRGDNHQTIHAGSKGEQEILGIMDGFLHRFQGCDTNHEPDSLFDEVINLDVAASSVENLETVITHLYHVYPGIFKGEMPSHQDMEEAVQFAMNNVIGADSMHDLSFKNQPNAAASTFKPKNNNSRQATPELKPQTPEQLVKRLEYFGITLSATNINSILSSVFQNASLDEARFYKQLKGTNRVQKEFHVTLVHRANASSKPDLWKMYTDLYTAAVEKESNPERTPSLGPARLRLERVIWDDRLMGILVRILPAAGGTVWACSNEYPHITIGTAGDNIKPVETSSLVQRWVESDGQDLSIHSKEIQGMKELDGAVKPVLQRGR